MTNNDLKEVRKLRKLGKLIAKKQRLDQKCTDCNEYNQEKHYCPKFCDVIRNTTEEMQEYYNGEHEKLDQIKQIVNNYDGSMYSMIQQFNEIQKVLEKE